MVYVTQIFFTTRTSGQYAGSFQRRRFSNEDVTVTLPAGTDVCDIGTITIWCQPFRAIFTRLAIPRSTFVSVINCFNSSSNLYQFVPLTQHAIMLSKMFLWSKSHALRRDIRRFLSYLHSTTISYAIL